MGLNTISNPFKSVSFALLSLPIATEPIDNSQLRISHPPGSPCSLKQTFKVFEGFWIVFQPRSATVPWTIDISWMCTTLHVFHPIHKQISPMWFSCPPPRLPLLPYVVLLVCLKTAERERSMSADCTSFMSSQKLYLFTGKCMDKCFVLQ